MSLLRTLAAAAALLAAAPALAVPGDEACKRELFMADAAVSGSYRNMEMGGAKPEEQCAAWRRHGEAMRGKVAGLTLQTLAGGHMLPLTQPQATAGFIRGMAARAGLGP